MRAQLIAGVYRLYDGCGRSFVGFSRNVEGTRKRLMFELALNACSYKPLQELYNESGGLTFELLEEFSPESELDDVVMDAQLRARLYRWCGELGDKAVQIQRPI
ncbi:MAG: hypothetical protein Q4B99_05285 [Clostridia bacterium]|nr:hypothetical protein [Clostridia bacterium]